VAGQVIAHDLVIISYWPATSAAREKINSDAKNACLSARLRKWLLTRKYLMSSDHEGRRNSGFFCDVRVVATARQQNCEDCQAAQRSNPWVELFYDQMDFPVSYDPQSATRVEIRRRIPEIRQRLSTALQAAPVAKPMPSSRWSTAGWPRPGPDCQGTNMEGTDLAGELALNPERMAPELHRCGINPTNPAGRFEILLHLNATAGSASASVLARRCHVGRSHGVMVFAHQGGQTDKVITQERHRLKPSLLNL
jgi:hypothetical protein